jgi:hypothetical protein
MGSPPVLQQPRDSTLFGVECRRGYFIANITCATVFGLLYLAFIILACFGYLGA